MKIILNVPTEKFVARVVRHWTWPCFELCNLDQFCVWHFPSDCRLSLNRTFAFRLRSASSI